MKKYFLFAILFFVSHSFVFAQKVEWQQLTVFGAL